MKTVSIWIVCLAFLVLVLRDRVQCQDIDLYGEYGISLTEKEKKLWRNALRSKSSVTSLLLGAQYFEGKGVPRDHVKAYAWASVAAKQGSWKAEELQDAILRFLSQAKLRRAMKLARDLFDVTKTLE